MGFLMRLTLAGILLIAKSDEINADSDSMDSFDDDDDGEEEDTPKDKASEPIVDTPVTHSDLSTIALFPDSPDWRLETLEKTTLLAGIRNKGDFNFEIMSLRCYLHAAHDPTFFVQNYTDMQLNLPLGARSERTIDYSFLPWQGISPQKYLFSAEIRVSQVFTKDEQFEQGKPKEWTWMVLKEQPVVFYTTGGLIDFQLIFILIVMLACCGICVLWCRNTYLVYDAEQKKISQQKYLDDWTPDLNSQPARGRARRRKN